jgi:hypothetical protein
MKPLVPLALLALLAACAAPAPPVTPTHSETAAPSPTASPVAAVRVGDWSASCDGVSLADCQGVAALFVNNLAWSGKAVLRDSGGKLSVTPRPECPTVPSYIDASFCWQATASLPSGSVCMVIAKQADPAKAGNDFGQVGGDEMAGLAGGPPCPPVSSWQSCH